MKEGEREKEIEGFVVYKSLYKNKKRFIVRNWLV